MSAGGVSTGCASAPESAAGAGLVSYKTNGKSVSFAPSIVAERRVKRLKKSVWASGHLHGIAEPGFRPPVVWFVTLTYRGATDWAANHIKQAIDGFRNWCKSRGYPCRYTWVAEIQPKRLENTGQAVVHYHLLAWLPQGARMPCWDRRTVTPTGRKMACWWPHGMTNRQIAKSGVGYLMKYLSKLGELTRFPKGLRLYGVGGLTDNGRAIRSWLNFPEWVKASYGVGEVKRLARSFMVRLTGEIVDAAYRVSRMPDGIALHPLRELPIAFHNGAYCSFPRAC